MTTPMQRIAEALFTAANHQHIPFKEIATKANTHEGVRLTAGDVQRMSTGKRPITLDEAVAFLDVLGLDLRILTQDVDLTSPGMSRADLTARLADAARRTADLTEQVTHLRQSLRDAQAAAGRPRPANPAVQRLPLAVLALSNRVRNALRIAGIATVGDLVSLTEDDLRDLRSVGVGAIREIQVALAEIGESLAPRDTPRPTR